MTDRVEHGEPHCRARRALLKKRNQALQSNTPAGLEQKNISRLQPLLQWLQPGDVLLLKASRGVALERLIPLL